jgi:hypothetical protein
MPMNQKLLRLPVLSKQAQGSSAGRGGNSKNSKPGNKPGNQFGNQFGNQPGNQTVPGDDSYDVIMDMLRLSKTSGPFLAVLSTCPGVVDVKLGGSGFGTEKINTSMLVSIIDFTDSFGIWRCWENRKDHPDKVIDNKSHFEKGLWYVGIDSFSTSAGVKKQAYPVLNFYPPAGPDGLIPLKNNFVLNRGRGRFNFGLDSKKRLENFLSSMKAEGKYDRKVDSKLHIFPVINKEFLFYNNSAYSLRDYPLNPVSLSYSFEFRKSDTDLASDDVFYDMTFFNERGGL